MPRPDPSGITDLSQFQTALAELLALSGSIREIARASGISKTTAAQILNRKRLPHRATMDLIVSRLDPLHQDQWLTAGMRSGPNRRNPSPLRWSRGSSPPR